jgi:hypothetical protein
VAIEPSLGIVRRYIEIEGLLEPLENVDKR